MNQFQKFLYRYIGPSTFITFYSTTIVGSIIGGMTGVGISIIDGYNDMINYNNKNNYNKIQVTGLISTRLVTYPIIGVCSGAIIGVTFPLSLPIIYYQLHKKVN